VGSFSLVLIAGFVWLAGRAEQRLIEARSARQADDGWMAPAADPWGRTAAPGPFAPAESWRWPQSRPIGRRFVVEAGPFGYVIREL